MQTGMLLPHAANGHANAKSGETRPVWTGFKIAVRLKLLTHYKKAKVSYEKSKDGLKEINVKNIY